MPFITIKIGNNKIIALIDIKSQKSFISIEAATRCELLRLIDRKKVKNIVGIEPPIAIYGKIYNQNIIINNGKINGKPNIVNK